MVDIDPAALSRTALSASTPVLSSKSLAGSAGSAQKLPVKQGPILLPRFDPEPIYTKLKNFISKDDWLLYKDAMNRFLRGILNQDELSRIIDPILDSPNGDRDKMHLHNKLITLLIYNLVRDAPVEPGPAPWVTQNDKPSTALGPKAQTGDNNEARFKAEVMQLPSRDRRRLKDTIQNEYDPNYDLDAVFTGTHRRKPVTKPAPTDGASVTTGSTALAATSGGELNKLNLDLEIRKKWQQPLSIESGEFPTTEAIEQRMLPLCYEAKLPSGHHAEAASLLTVAAETFMREMLGEVYALTRANGPGDSGPAGFGLGTTWIQTRRYRKQLRQEEDAFQRGEITRDKSGLLPIEARAAHERTALSMGDVRLALEVSPCGVQNFPAVAMDVLHGYREGELEHYDKYTTLDGMEGKILPGDGSSVHHIGSNGTLAPTNGVTPPEAAAAAPDAVGVTGVNTLPNGNAGLPTKAVAAAAVEAAVTHAVQPPQDHKESVILPNIMDVDDTPLAWEGGNIDDLVGLQGTLDEILSGTS